MNPMTTDGGQMIVIGLACPGCGSREPHSLKCCNQCKHYRLPTHDDIQHWLEQMEPKEET